ncbi:MAG: protein kinase [bacterium]|nr:protein kinase [bacterium]
MTEVLKAKSKLSKGRYIITKAHSSGDDGTVYFAQDQERGSACVIREFYSSRKLSQEEQAEYDERFQNCMLILSQFNHPNLTDIYDSFTEKGRYYVVMEMVDGITLKTLLGMSVKPLPEKQVLTWMLQVCQAMQYMHNRPKPFIFDALDANNIMIDQSENIKLINFGLSNFFTNAEAISFSSSPALISKEIQQMGRTLAFLLTREEVSELGFTPADDKVSEPLVKLVNRLLSEGNGGVDNFDKLQHELENIINPPKIKERKSSAKTARFKFINYSKLFESAIETVLRQPIWLIGSEILAVIAVGIGIYFYCNPPVDARLQSAVYLACGNELHIYSAANKTPLGRVRLKYGVNNLYPCRNGVKLYCSLANSSHVAIFNAQTNRLIDSFPVGKNPGMMIMDPSENWLYVLHSSEGLVSAVQAAHDPLPETEKVNFSKEKTTGIYSVGSNAHGLTLYRESAASDKTTASSAQYNDLVLCTSSSGNTADIFSNPPMESKGSHYCKSAGPAVVTKDSSMAIVGQLDSSHLEFFRISDFKSVGTVSQTGGSNIKQLLLSPNAQEVWCINGSGSIGIVDIASKKLTDSIKVEGKPVDAIWNTLSGSKFEVWVATASPNKLVIIDPTTKTVTQNIDLSGTPSDICLINAPPISK